MSLTLYSPLNFLVGVEVWLTRRAYLTMHQALAEAQVQAPRWQYRLAAGALTTVLVLMATALAIPKVEPLVHTLAPRVSTSQATVGIGLLVALFMAVAVLNVTLRVFRSYRYFCRIGSIERVRRAL